MPNTVNYPVDLHRDRQNRRAELLSETGQHRPQTEQIYSGLVDQGAVPSPSETVNSVGYYNELEKIPISRRFFASGGISPSIRQASGQEFPLGDSVSQLYSRYETANYLPPPLPPPSTRQPPTRLPPLPPKPPLPPYMPLHSGLTQVVSSLGRPNPKQASVLSLAPVSESEFISARQRQKHLANIQIAPEKNFSQPQKNLASKSGGGGTGKRQFILGFGLLGLGLGMFTVYDSMMLSMLDSAMVLKEGGPLTEGWQNIPMPLDACFYLWGLGNGKQFLKGAKPRVIEYGPFCYFEYKKRNILKWEEHSVTFTERFDFKFNEKTSQSLDTSMEMLNLPLLLTVYMTKHILETFYLSFTSPLVFNMLAMTMKATGEELIEKRTAREMLQGRKIKMVEYSELMLKPLKVLGIPVPGFGVGAYTMHNASFGIVAQRMWTDFGPFEVYTKTENGHTFGDIKSLNDMTTMPMYRAPCNEMKGGDGMFFGPNCKKERLDVFNQHACRYLSFVKNDTVTVNGMTIVRYTVDPHIFDMSQRRNRCYCLGGRTWQECDGWTDMSPCMGGIPMGLSLPHFYNSPRRQAAIDGLAPEAAKHFGHLDLEPQLGIPIGANIAIQGTIFIKAIKSVSTMATLPTVVLPLFWVQEGANVKGAMAVGMSIGSNSIRYGSFAFLAGGIVSASALFYKGNKKRNERKRLEAEE